MASASAARTLAAWRSVGPRMAAGIRIAMIGAFSRVTAIARGASLSLGGGLMAGLGSGISARRYAGQFDGRYTRPIRNYVCALRWL